MRFLAKFSILCVLSFILSSCSLKASLSDLVSDASTETQAPPLAFTLSLSNSTVTSTTVDQNMISFVTVTLNQARNVDTVFNLIESSPDGATASDYDLAVSTVTILAGQTTATVALTIKNKSGSKDFDKRVNVELQTSDSAFTTQSRTEQFTITDSNPLVLTVNPMYPVNGAKWNDYVNGFASVSFSHVSPYLKIKAENFPSDGVCVNNCLHGGELKKVVISNKTQCGSLAVTDSENAFEWRCADHVTPIYFYSVGFKKGKGLRDLLLVEGTDFKSMTISLTESSNPIGTSVAAKWWSNPVEALSAAQMNSGGADPVKDLSTESKIFVLTQSASSRGLRFLNDKMSFVTMIGVTLSSTATIASTFLINSNFSMNWIEAQINSIAANPIVLHFLNTAYEYQTRVHNTNVQGTSNAIGLMSSFKYGLVISNSHFNTFSEALYLDNFSSNVLIYESTIRNTNSTALQSNAAGMIIYKSQFLKGNSYAILSNSSLETITESQFSNYALVGYSSSGGTRTKQVTNSLFTNNSLGLIGFQAVNMHSINVINNSNTGLFVELFRIVNSNIINNGKGIVSNNTSSTVNSESFAITVADNITSDIEFSNSSQNHLFYDALNLGSGVNKCVFGTGLTNIGLSTADCIQAGASSITRTADINSSQLFEGFVNDTTNTHGSSGSTGFLFSSITDFFKFENFNRIWSKFHVTMSWPSTNLSGVCTSGSCGIFDYSLKANAPHLKKANGIFLAHQSCPVSIKGSNYFTYLDATIVNKKALKFALEYVLDGIGNDNGLCEANETCYFNPDTGAYLVEPEKFTDTCVYDSDGDPTLVNIKIYGSSI